MTAMWSTCGHIKVFLDHPNLKIAGSILAYRKEVYADSLLTLVKMYFSKENLLSKVYLVLFCRFDKLENNRIIGKT
jgi:hypothetical protein